jgi:hypothetical protein
MSMGLQQKCPETLTESGFVHDLALLAESVSWEPKSTQQNVSGRCGNYINIYENHGKFDTLLRVYTNPKTNDTIFSFRPTQQSRAGGDIHNNRRLAACRFLDGSCYGMVNDRFQQAFQDLVRDIPEELFSDLSYQRVSTVGHSLGGSLQLFMAIYLFEQYDITPSYVLGFAGPFIGDKIFTQTYIDPLKDEVDENMWQIMTIDVLNPTTNYDNSIEGYNVNNGDGSPDWNILPFNPLSPFQPNIPQDILVKTPIFIDERDVCGVNIIPVEDSYSMHDLKNYRLAFNGTECV